MSAFKTLLALLVLIIALGACGEDTAPVENQDAIEKANQAKAEEERVKTAADAKALADAQTAAEAKSAAADKALADANAAAAAVTAAANAAAAKAAETANTAASSANATATNNSTIPDNALKLSISDYSKELFGYSQGQPMIQNTNWQTELTADFNAIHSVCQNGGSSCPVANYDVFYNTGFQIGQSLFDQYYNTQPNLLTCNGQLSNYLGGFVQGGWMNNIQVVIDVQIYVNGQLFNQEHYQESQYAPIIIQRLIDAFREKYEAIANNPNQCYNQPIIAAPQVNGGIGGGFNGGFNGGVGGGCNGGIGGQCQQTVQYPICDYQIPVYVNPCGATGPCNSNAYGYGQGYGSGYGTIGGYGQGGMGYGIGASVGGSSVDYSGSSVNQIGWNVTVGASGNNW